MINKNMKSQQESICSADDRHNARCSFKTASIRLNLSRVIFHHLDYHCANVNIFAMFSDRMVCFVKRLNLQCHKSFSPGIDTSF